MKRARSHSVLLLVLTLAVGSFAAPAKAKLPSSARVLLFHKKLEPHRQLRLSNHTIRYARNALLFLRANPKAGTTRSRAVVRKNHTWLLSFGEAKRHAAMERLSPTYSIAHYAGWHCITYGAYPGAPHEGHGYNGPYSGPLQQTTPWEGISLPWASMSDAAVYAVAERVAAAHGFSYAWMAGQWPNTFPPCAGLF